MSDSEEKQQGVKRSYDSHDGPASKKAHSDGDDQLAVKLLIPSNAVGAIIGKGGEAMRALKADYQCRVQMSKTSDTYPGTNERVCLLKGKVPNVVNVVRAIQDKIREKCDTVVNDAFDHKNVSRANEIKIVMPNTSAGMVIGKAGANIKDIRETFGIQIQVFPKAGSPEAKNSLERVVTIAHDDSTVIMNAASRILEKVASDPHHGSEIAKEDFGGKGGFNPNSSFNSNAGGGFNQNNFPHGGGNFQGGFNYQQQGQMNGGTQIKYNPMQGLGNNELLSFLDNLQNTLRTSGFNEASVSEVMSAMQVLAKYNIMGLGLGLGVAAMAQMRSGQESGGVQQSMPANHGAAGFGDQGGYPDSSSFWRRG